MIRKFAEKKLNKYFFIKIFFISFFLLFINNFDYVLAKNTKPKIKKPRIKKEELIKINFRNADIMSVIEFYSDLFNKTFIPNQELTGNITVISPKPIPALEAKRLLYSILDMKGFAVVEQDNFFKIVHKSQAVHDALKVNPKGYGGDRMYTDVIPLKFLKGETIVGDLRRILSPEAAIFAGKATNYIAVTDTAANIKKVKALVAKIDLPQSIPKILPYQLQYIKATSIAKVLSDIFKSNKVQSASEVKINPMKENNELIITATTQQHKQIKKLLKELDKRTAQVSISAMLVEVSLDDNLNLGIEWDIKAGSAEFAQNTPAGSKDILYNIIKSTGDLVLPGLSQGLSISLLSSDQYAALINFLSTKLQSNVVSAPHILAMNNQKATINVSRQVPILKLSRTNDNESNTIDKVYSEEKFGMNLEITPTVAENRDVTLKIDQKLSNLTSPITDTANGYQALSREAKTTVIVKDRNTLVIGGLMSSQRKYQVTGIPFLRDIPLIGFLFGTEVTTYRKSELLIFITPTVVEYPKDEEELNNMYKMRNPNVVNEAGIEFDI